jgi:hypothetical protein
MEYIACTAYPPKKVVQTIGARNAPVNVFTAHCSWLMAHGSLQEYICRARPAGPARMRFFILCLGFKSFSFYF